MADAPRSSDLSFDDAVDAGAARLSRGESLDSILRAYPQHANTMREPLSALQPVLAIPLAVPSPQSRAKAARDMFAALDAPKPRRMSLLAGFWSTLGARHLRFQAAAAGLAVVLFGGIGLASAAGDRSPVPVPGFLHVLAISSDNAVELRGTIVALDASSLTLRTASGDQVITFDAATDIRIGEAHGTASDLALGQTAAVRASRDVAGTLHATRIRAAAVPTPSAADPTPVIDTGLDVATPATDDHGDDGAGQGTAEPGDDNAHDAAPEAGEHGEDSTGDDGASNNNGSDGSGDDEHSDIAVPSATSSSGGGHDDHEDATVTPSSGDDGAHEAQSPEPTERPEPTEKPEATEPPEPTEDHH